MKGDHLGGCSVLWNSNLNASIPPVLCNRNRRCAVSFNVNGLNLLICCVYFPCGNNSHSLEYGDTLFVELSSMLTWQDVK